MRKTLPEMRCELCLATLQSTEQQSSAPQSHFPKLFPQKYNVGILGKKKCRNILVKLSVNLTFEHQVPVSISWDVLTTFRLSPTSRSPVVLILADVLNPSLKASLQDVLAVLSF